MGFEEDQESTRRWQQGAALVADHENLTVAMQVGDLQGMEFSRL